MEVILGLGRRQWEKKQIAYQRFEHRRIIDLLVFLDLITDEVHLIFDSVSLKTRSSTSRIASIVDLFLLRFFNRVA